MLSVKTVIEKLEGFSFYVLLVPTFSRIISEFLSEKLLHVEGTSVHTKVCARKNHSFKYEMVVTVCRAWHYF